MKVVEIFEDKKKEADSEARAEVSRAVGILDGKTGYRTAGGTTRDVTLSIYWGHNIYVTVIRIDDSERRIEGAEFYDGAFRSVFSGSKVELI